MRKSPITSQPSRSNRSRNIPARFRNEEEDVLSQQEAAVRVEKQTAAVSDPDTAAAEDDGNWFSRGEIRPAGIASIDQSPPVALGGEVSQPVDNDEVLPCQIDVLQRFVENNDQIVGARWGELDGFDLSNKVDKIYLEVSRWRRNLFYLPTCKAGQEFIAELARIFNLFTSGSAFEPIAFTMAAIIFPLVLQKPARDSKTAENKKYLEKRLQLWKRGDLDDLLNEGRTIQKRFSRKKKSTPEKKEKRFVKLMEIGKVSAALRCVGSQETGVLKTTPEVLQELRAKHPPSENPHIRSLIQGPFPRVPVEEVIYEDINSNKIYDAAKKVSGAVGPSERIQSCGHDYSAQSNSKRSLPSSARH